MQEDIIAVFPLPNVVFFPKTKLPLHIFEPRYCEMIRESIQNKQLIGMFVLEPGWEQNYYGNPSVYPIGCAGEIVQVETLEDGKYNIILEGLYRARSLEEVQVLPYRRARVEVLPENESGQGLAEAGQLLVKDFTRLCAESGTTDPSAVEGMTDPAEIVNNIATLLPLDLEVKLELLQESSLLNRARIVERILTHQLAAFDWIKQFKRLRPSDPNVN